MTRHHRLAAAFGLVALLTSGVALASTPFAGEDFDGGTIGGFTADTMEFTPALPGQIDPNTMTEVPLSSSQPFRSGFGTSRFDRFGEVSRLDTRFSGDDEGIPFALADDSLGTFEADTEGFVALDKTDDFVLSTDPDNGQNPGGNVSAEWTFDISGRENLELSIDFGMFGTFEATDSYEFTYSIDGAPAESAFSITGLEGVFYSYTMDSGTFVDRTTNGFFSETDWNDLVQFGEEPGVIEFHPADTGLDGDSVAQDGFIPVTFADGVEEVRANTDINVNGTFNETEFEPVQNPLGITTGDGSLVAEALVADFVAYTTALNGTGSTLTLTLNGVSNGGDEYFVFDNIVLSEADDIGLAADFNGDGTVDLLDLDILGANFGGPGTAATGDANGDMTVDLLDLDILGSQFGQSASAAAAIPEPAAAALALLAMAGVARRSRS
ncbi:MAG: hypothetical protein AAF266_04240 [Planctomycetota bacterium]